MNELFYTGYSGVTNGNGQVGLALPPGSYRFRVDKPGKQFWSDTGNHCMVPGCTSVLVITQEKVVVTVLHNGVDPEVGLTVMAYDAMTYAGVSAITNAQGQATFWMSAGNYRFKTVKTGMTFWSGPDNHCTIIGCTSAGITTFDPTPTQTPTPTMTHTPTFSPTITSTSTVTHTATWTATPTNTPTETPTFTPTDTPTQTATPTVTPTDTPSYTPTITPTFTSTFTPTDTPTITQTPTITLTPTATFPPGAVIITVLNTSGQPEVGLSVWAMDGAKYTGYSGVTNGNGQVGLALPPGSYRFRVDKPGYQFWSGTDNHCSVPGCTSVVVTTKERVIVTVLDTSGNPETGFTVMAYNGSTYAGYSVITNAQGQATFWMSAGSYRFKTTKNGTTFWSGTGNHCTVVGCSSAGITTTVPVVVTVLSNTGVLQANLKVWVFDETTWSGYGGTTNAQGQVTLTLPQGYYRFRVDYPGYQFWSGTNNHCAVPGCTSTTVTLNISVTVTVLNGSFPDSGVNVWVFNNSTWTGLGGVTNAQGQVTFTLPVGGYRFRVDKPGKQFWSSTYNHCAIPGCTSITVPTTDRVQVTVLDTSGNPEVGINVLAYNGSSYTGYAAITNAQGVATFWLPVGDYRFRATKYATAFWSGPANHCTIRGCSAAGITTTTPVVVTVLDTLGSPQNNINVWAFNGEIWANVGAKTNAQGKATLVLLQGSYRFRVDMPGRQYWSNTDNHCTVPGCTAVGVTVNAPVIVTVLDTGGIPEAGINVLAYSGSYFTGVAALTNAQGQASLALAAGEYRFRTTKNGTAFWSGNSNHCTVPSCTSAGITTTLPVVVTVLDGLSQPVIGVKVYAMNDEIWAGYMATTDSNGQVSLTLPLGSYRFRVDTPTQYWSGPGNHCTIPGCIAVTVTVGSAGYAFTQNPWNATLAGTFTPSGSLAVRWMSPFPQVAAA